MKAVRLHQFDESLQRPNLVEIEDVPEPRIQERDDVIVRIGGAGLCRTDLHIVEGIWSKKVDRPLPYILGHENAGWVHDVGDDVENVKVYISGGAGMVYATLDLFVDHGMPESNLHSDIFSYAPRK